MRLFRHSPFARWRRPSPAERCRARARARPHRRESVRSHSLRPFRSGKSEAERSRPDPDRFPFASGRGRAPANARRTGIATMSIPASVATVDAARFAPPPRGRAPRCSEEFRSLAIGGGEGDCRRRWRRMRLPRLAIRRIRIRIWRISHNYNVSILWPNHQRIFHVLLLQISFT